MAWADRYELDACATQLAHGIREHRETEVSGYQPQDCLDAGRLLGDIGGSSCLLADSQYLVIEARDHFTREHYKGLIDDLSHVDGPAAGKPMSAGDRCRQIVVDELLEDQTIGVDRWAQKANVEPT